VHESGHLLASFQMLPLGPRFQDKTQEKGVYLFCASELLSALVRGVASSERQDHLFQDEACFQVLMALIQLSLSLNPSHAYYTLIGRTQSLFFWTDTRLDRLKTRTQKVS
jgi:hypothetical protein